MMVMVGLFKLYAGVSMFIIDKKIKRRDPIAYDLLVSGTYKQRKVRSKLAYKRTFKNQKDFELRT